MKQFSLLYQSTLFGFLVMLNCAVFTGITASVARADDNPFPEIFIPSGCKMDKYIPNTEVPMYTLNCRGVSLEGRSFTSVDYSDRGDAYKGFFQSVDFNGANLNNAAFRDSSLDNSVSFRNAKLQNAVFENTKLGDVTFKGADLTNASITYGKQDANDYSMYFDGDFTNSTLRNATFKNVKMTENLNNSFASADLTNIKIDGAVFKGNTFTNTNLSGAIITNSVMDFSRLGNSDFTNARLKNVAFRVTSLRNADFSGAKLEKIFLVQTDLEGANFSNASLAGVNLGNNCYEQQCAYFSGTNFTGANLKGVSFQGAILDGSSRAPFSFSLSGTNSGDASIFLNADLEGANLSNARLNGVDFSRANLAKVKFQGVESADASFSRAILSLANFTGAKLYGINFEGATLTNTKFNGATITRTQETAKDTNFECSYLGGADFSNAKVNYTNLEYAVIPLARNCKSDASNPSGYFCGIDPFTQAAYGPTTKFPSVDKSVICPNGGRGPCSNSQLSFSNWTTSDCGSPKIRWLPTKQSSSGNTVNIPDSNLKRCIAQQMYHNHDAAIDEQHAKSVRVISCPGNGISNASGLDSFTALERLDLSNNNLRGGLTLNNDHLDNLNLEGNQVSKLTLSANTNPLALNLSHNKLSEFDLSTEDDLISADLSYNNLTSVGNVSSDTNLIELFLDDNNLRTIGNVSDLVNKYSLYKLSLKNNPNFVCSSLGLPTDNRVYQDSNCGQ